ncbi:MAG: cardiolipin synthase [Firmicutes bacterium]|nr:cardiolipin synthase [Bacillota bacterium]
MGRKNERTIAGIIRLVFVGLLILAQIFLVALVVRHLKHNTVYLYLLLEAFSLVAILWLLNNSGNSSYAVVWLVVILLLPVFGFLLYLLWGWAAPRSRKSRRTQQALRRGIQFLKHDPEVYAELEQAHPWRKRMAGFLIREGFPLYKNTRCQYYPLGELQFEQMIRDLEKAERFIFIEYYILAQGRLWERIYEVLRRKARQGVEVRILYDDLGSIITLPNNFMAQLKNEGIQALAFNPVHRYVSRLYINYRNHQKIVVIDGNIGYTGGTNLADEYANLYPKYGHWKDTAIRLEGEAVWSLTVTFLQMWEAESREKDDYLKYRPSVNITGDGFYQPFADSPVNNPNNPAETMYRQLIANAREYVYITTPYLIIDDTMAETLCTAAKSGVDVRIITPKITDHWYVHIVTRSNYGRLLKAGVRIYEYSPGYIHAKTIISDDDHAVTGSINMDYRSFNLQFENGVWICGAPVLKAIKEDILATFAVSEEIDLAAWQRRSWLVKSLEGVFRLFAPLL